MKTKIVEATDAARFNWGKFMVMRPDVEFARTSTVMAEDRVGLLSQRGWGPEHLIVLDLETNEGAVFRPGGSAPADLERHLIHVCPMFEPFLEWLYRQDLTDLDALPVPAHEKRPSLP